MKSYVGHLRVAIALQIVLVAIAISTFTERLRLSADLLRIEKYVLARLLMETSSAMTQLSDKETTDLSNNNPENYFGALRAYKKSDDLGEVKALANFMENGEWRMRNGE